MAEDGKQIVNIVWEGVAIEVTYSPSDIMAQAHLELRVATKEPIPVTETGYRSHFLPRGVVEANGGPEKFVLDWLDAEGQGKEWKASQEAAKQYQLF